MKEIRSCERCKYGPNYFACQMGKTGKSISPVSWEFNPFQPAGPTRYRLNNPTQMPCFQPRNNIGKPRKVDDIKELLPILMTIGAVKRSLPLQLRDWVNILGLYVQFHSREGRESLAAGGKYRSYFEALNPDTSNTDAFFGKADAWEIRKFDKKVWDNRFAHLVLPTSDVALFISGGNSYGEASGQFNEQASAILMQVIRHFEATGEWLSLPSNRVCVTCGREPTIEQWQGELCPYCGASFRIKGNRSCEQCKYGPDFFACLKGETGKPASSEPFVFNPFGPSPTKYHLSNSSQMFCFQPRNNKESSPDAMTPMDSSQKSTGIRAGYNCKYGPSCFGCQLGLESMEAHEEAFRLTPFQMPCWEPLDDEEGKR